MLDLPLKYTLLYRCQLLLKNRSSSEQFKKELQRLFTAMLIRRVRGLIDFADVGGRGVLGVYGFAKRLNAACSDAYRDILSARNTCVLVKMIDFVRSNSPKNSHKITKKEVKNWNADECEQRAVQESVIREYHGLYLKKEIKENLSDAIGSFTEEFRLLLKKPGAKTRLLW